MALLELHTYDPLFFEKLHLFLLLIDLATKKGDSEPLIYACYLRLESKVALSLSLLILHNSP